MFISEKIERRLHEGRYDHDFYAPEMKANIMDYNKFKLLSSEKMDIWSFGMTLYHMFNLSAPVFNENAEPIFTRTGLAPELRGLIIACLSKAPDNRPGWADINLLQLARFRPGRELSVVRASEHVDGFSNVHVVEEKELGYGEESPVKLGSENKVPLFLADLPNDELQRYNKQEYKESLQNIRLFKAVLRIILEVLLLLLAFFLPFIVNSVTLLARRGFFRKFQVVNADMNLLYFSGTTILTDQPEYFAFNSLTFQQLTALQCIRDEFDPVVNPSFSFFQFIRSGSFFWWTLAGLLLCGGILALRGAMAFRANFWTFYQERSSWKVWVAWAFNELAFAAVLFAHFYIFGFQYFAGASPCLKIASLGGVEPFFDSALYLILGNVAGFMANVFTVIGVLALLMVVSNGLFAVRPMEEDKTFLHPAVFLLRVLAFVALLLLGRVGLFQIIGPSALNDPTSIILSALGHSYTGFVGFIPELVILMMLALSSLLELSFYFVEKKAIESDKFRNFFTMKKKHRVADASSEFLQVSDNSRMEEGHLPERSMLVE